MAEGQEGYSPDDYSDVARDIITLSPKEWTAKQKAKAEAKAAAARATAMVPAKTRVDIGHIQSDKTLQELQRQRQLRKRKAA